MTSITINVDDDLMSSLKKRADKKFFSVSELCSDIVRRSMISYKNRSEVKDVKVDDKIVNIFSRSRRGRKKKKK